MSGKYEGETGLTDILKTSDRYQYRIEVKSASLGLRQTDSVKSPSARARESRMAQPITFSGWIGAAGGTEVMNG